ncbi:MAG: helix-turn-helix domain-containing protein [Candidatus Coatesbacteria bacterium]
MRPKANTGADAMPVWVSVIPECRGFGTARMPVPNSSRRKGGWWPWRVLLVEYKRLREGHSFPVHRHPPGLFEFYAVMAGKVTLSVRGRAPIEVGTGRAVLLPSLAAHSMESAGGATVVNMHFPLSRREPWLKMLNLLEGKVSGLSPSAMATVRQLVQLNSRPRALRPYLAHALLSSMLLSAAAEARSGVPRGVVREAGSPLADRVRWLIEHRLSGRWINTDIAKALGMSVRALEERYRAETGGSLHAAVIRMRLDRARHLMASGSVSVKRAAFECGFRDPSYFVRAYRRVHGVTPGELVQGRSA